ncbi:MAG: LysR family transcriptional regulator [Beijerinckiaceae bacterium]|nr:LysR family transcriptional regulator [Beijerinckiaceae bacterium]
MNATFRQLRLFLALADEGSMTRAAQKCHITQPTASMQLRELSLSIGLPLYEVIGKKIHLTDIGKELAATARAMLGEWNAFQQVTDRTKGLSRGELRVAVVSTAKYFIPRMLGRFCETYPEIDIKLDVFNRDGVIQALRENKVDLAVMSVPPSDLDVETEMFLNNPLVVIAPPHHPLTKQHNIPLSVLANEAFILREEGSGTRMMAERFFAAHGIRPRVKLNLGSNEAIKEAVAGGLGCAVLSHHAVAAYRIDGSIAVLDVEGFPIQSQWFTVTLHGKRLGPIAAMFRNDLREMSKEISASFKF